MDTKSKEYEPSAFPRYVTDETGQGAIDGGMILRDYFTIHASEKDLERYLPETIEETRDMLISEGFIPADRVKQQPYRSYTGTEARKLRSLARYKFADDMMEMRNNFSSKKS